MKRAWILLVVLSLAVFSLGGPAGAQQAPPDFTAAFRPILEEQLQKNAGIGFASFACEPEGPPGPDARILCSAIDEDGDTLRYTIANNDAGELVVARTEQPASSLSAEDLEKLETPCRAFLADYGRQRWKELHSDLHPSLRDTIDLPRTKEILSAVRADFGALQSAEPSWFAMRFSGAQELEYRLLSERGEGLARFEITSDDAGELRILAFVVTAHPGSPEQARMLERAADETLSPLTGAPLVRFELPLDELQVRGDAVEGPVFLDSGREVLIRVEQSGHRDDFNPVDFQFYVLEVQLMVERALAEKLPGIVSVECASRTAPDGGETPCTVTAGDGSTLELVVRRKGGEHRMFRAGATAEPTH
jgi:hypothetical protein